MSNSKELSQLASFVEVNANTETVTISANLVVTGTTTTISTEQVNISDNILLLNSDLSGGSVPTQDAGIRINRGSANTVGFIYDESADAWVVENNDGSVATVQTISGTSKIDLVTPALLDNLHINDYGLVVDGAGVFVPGANGEITVRAVAKTNTTATGNPTTVLGGNSTNNSGAATSGNLVLQGGIAQSLTSDATGGDVIISGGNASGAGTATKGNVKINNMIMPTEADVAAASNNQVLVIDGNGKLNFFDRSSGGGVDLTAFSAVNSGTASGSGSLQYNNTTGVFTFIPPDLPTSLLDLGISDGANGTVLTTDGQGNFAFLSVAAATGGGISLTDLSVAAEGTPSGNGSLTYNNITGQFTYTPPTATGIGAIALSSLSVAAENTAAGNGGLSYNNTTGEFTYTPPTAAGIGALADTTLDHVAKHLSVTVASESGGGNLEFANNTGIFTYTPPAIKDTVFNSIQIGANNPASGDGSIQFAVISGNGVFQYTPPDLSSYVTSETNDLTSSVTWVTVPDTYISSNSVTQHEGDLSISTSQITDISSNYLALTGGTLSGDLTLSSGSIKGPATFVIDPAVHGANTGTVVIKGNLQIDGTTTTLNSSTLDVEDVNITIAKGAIDAAAADGAGLTIDGASATFTYDATNDRFTSNKDFAVDVVGDVSGNVYGMLYTTDAGTVQKTVKVVSKTSAHPANGSGSSQGYEINGTQSPTLRLVPGVTYRFDQSDSSNSGHPFLFYLDESKTTAYTTGVTTNGTPGQAGAYTQIVPSTTTPGLLWYQCQAHSNMGWAAEVVVSARDSVSVTKAAAGSANLVYNSTTGVFTYTPPDLSGYLTSETSHADVLVDGDFTSAGFMKTNGSGTYSVDTNTYLTSYTETDPVFSAHTTSGISNGTGFLKNNGSGTWSYDNSTYLTSYTTELSEDTTPELGGTLNTVGNPIQFRSGSTTDYVQVQAASGTGTWTMTLPTGDGTSGQVLTTDGSGNLSFADSSSGTDEATVFQIAYKTALLFG